MSDPASHVVLDTNIFLHFRRPDLIDWNTLLGVARVNLLVTPALIDELEVQKTYQNRSRKLKERAHNAIMWLSQFADSLESQEIRPGVWLVFVRNSPTIDFSTYKLSHTVPDDQLIASAIQFKQETGAHVLFVSNDTGLRMKLPTRGLTAVAPPQADQLPDELDEVEKGAIELRQRLDRYESRIPKLTLTFGDRKSFSEIELLSPAKTPSKLPGPSELKLEMDRAAEYVSEYTIWRRTRAFIFLATFSSKMPVPRRPLISKLASRFPSS